MKAYTLKTLRDDLNRLFDSGVKQLDVTAETGIKQSVISNFASGKRGLHGEAALKLEVFLRNRAKDEDSLPSQV